MQHFKDSATGQEYAFEDEVVAAQDSNGIWNFTGDNDLLLTMPTTLEPYTPPAVDPVAVAQAAQVQELKKDYRSAIYASITFTTAAKVKATFQADPGSVSNLKNVLTAYTPGGALPTGFYWVAADNTQVPVTLADLQGMAKAMADAGWAAFKNLQTKKAAVAKATTVKAVQAVTF